MRVDFYLDSTESVLAVLSCRYRLQPEKTLHQSGSVTAKKLEICDKTFEREILRKFFSTMPIQFTLICLSLFVSMPLAVK